MKILQVHNYYQEAGGEDSVVLNEKNMLESAQHKVSQYTVNNDVIRTVYDKLSAAYNISYSQHSKERFLEHLRKELPDVVHVHNFFPLLTPSIFDACVEANVPSVLTLHNYRLLCPGGFLMRDGKICEDCIGASAYQAVLHGCYRRSRLETIPVSHMVMHHRKKNTWNKKVDAFIALTNLAKSKFTESGISEEKIHVKPNFVDDPFNGCFENNTNRNGALYVGRLSEEKGIKTLLNAWQDVSYPLRIVGDGPLKSMVQNSNNPSIEYLGQLPAKSVSEQMLQASFLVMPSEWYEGFPMVLAESLGHGLPVVASNIGAMKEVVRHNITGMHFDVANSDMLKQLILDLVNNKSLLQEMSSNAHADFLKAYSSDVNLNLLLGVYDVVCGR